VEDGSFPDRELDLTATFYDVGAGANPAWLMKGMGPRSAIDSDPVTGSPTVRVIDHQVGVAVPGPHAGAPELPTPATGESGHEDSDGDEGTHRHP